VEVAEAKHMTFSDMAVLQAWAGAGCFFRTEDATDGGRTLAVIWGSVCSLEVNSMFLAIRMRLILWKFDSSIIHLPAVQ
jgi:hypothetical protein